MPETGRGCRGPGRTVCKAMFSAAVVLAGLALLLYPFLADYLYEHRTEGVIAALDEASDEAADAEQNRTMLELAQQYNQRLRERCFLDTDMSVSASEKQKEEEEYRSLLSFDENGVMGYISIPCIDVNLPVYHGASETVLEKGAGHLYGTSLPVGGPGTHAVITAHTGIGKARFFTDLTDMKKGDIFVITVPGRRLVYCTDRIAVVSPEDTSALAIEEGKDYCTLLTCTPYGINSHRLLVRGERVKDEFVSEAVLQEEKRQSIFESGWIRHYLYSLLIAGSVMTGAAAVITVVRRMKSA